MIREINTELIVKAVREMCIEANHTLSPDMVSAMKAAADQEKSELGKKILNQLQENCQRGYDSDLSGYGNGRLFCRDRTRRTSDGGFH